MILSRAPRLMHTLPGCECQECWADQDPQLGRALINPPLGYDAAAKTHRSSTCEMTSVS